MPGSGSWPSLPPRLSPRESRKDWGTQPDLEQRLTGPLGRAGRPDDVARVVLFCASDLSMFMTGSLVLVDGGEMAR